MDQQGNVPGSGIQTIDQLRYNYEDNEQSNRLLKVGDAMPDYGTGDFVNTNGAGNDYTYDGNGNLASDANKGIDTIIYTHFDKPQEIRFSNGKSLEYSYDAAGGKVQELVRQPGQADKITDYIGGYVYENNALQYIPTAEGRTVRTTVNNDFKEEYFVKDHLGNIRSTVDVTVKPLQQYLATYELASANLEGLLFEQVAEIRDDNPSSTDTGNVKSGKLNGADQRIGTSLLVHVMAGDEIELNVNTFYEGYDAQNDNPVSAANMLNSIIGTLTGGVGGFQGSEGHNTAIVQQLFTPENYVGVYDNITGGITDPDRPKAYLNYVLFDENMAINSTFSSAFQASGNGSWEEIGTTAPLKIPANGYLAVYLSNRSQVTGCTGCGNVYFDQLQVRIQNGRLLEESHYYPFGLPMAGLSTETGTNTIRQRRKYQSNEYIKELGLNWMDFNARQYDPQLGRFLGVDPLATSGGQDMYSPYAAMGNAPESMVDPNGTSPGPGANSFSPNNPVMADMGATEGTKKMAFNQISVGGGFGGSGKGNSANENTQTLTLTGMLYTAYLQVGETANFSDGVFVSYGVMLPELEVVDHKPNYLSWGQGVNSQLGSISPLGSGFDDFAYNKAMANPYFRAAEMGYMPPMGSLHGTLDAAGLLPVIGEIFDGINGIYYSAEGDYENAAWSFAAMIPIGGTAITGAKIFRKAAKGISSVVKQDSKLLKLARETFEGNDLLRKEANGLIDQLTKGNLNPGIGSKNIGKNIFEARSRGGARVYFRNGENGAEIMGYSNKSNQQKVIDRILEIY